MFTTNKRSSVVGWILIIQRKQSILPNDPSFNTWQKIKLLFLRRFFLETF